MLVTESGSVSNSMFSNRFCRRFPAVGALADSVRLVEKVVAVAQRLLCILVDRDDDRLDVLEAMAFTCCPLAQCGERVEPWRVVRFFVVPIQFFADCHSAPSLPSGLSGRAPRHGGLVGRRDEAA